MDICECDARKLPFDGDQFDFVFCTGSTLNNLPSVEDMGIVVAEMVRVLKSSGRMLMVCLNLSNPKNLLWSILAYVHNRVLCIIYSIARKEHEKLNFGDAYYRPSRYNGIRGFAHLTSTKSLKTILHNVGVSYNVQTKDKYQGTKKFKLWQSQYLVIEVVKIRW